MSPRLRRLVLVLVAVVLVALLWWLWPAATTRQVGPEGGLTATRRRGRPGPEVLPGGVGAGPAAAVEEELTPEQEALARPFLGVTTVLDNGLTVIVIPRDDTRLVAARIVVRAGGSDDDVPGVAHLLEHLMFRGTPALGTLDWSRESPALDEVGRLLEELAGHPSRDLDEELAEAEREADEVALAGETQALLEQLGATHVNGTTTLDATTFHLVLPAHALEPWAWFELDRFSGPALRGFRLERNIVGLERVRRKQHVGGGPWGQLRSSLYRGHPYAQGVAGDDHTVGRSTPSDALAMFDRWYVPRNMAVVLVGPLDPEAAIELVAETLGTLPDHPVPRRERPPLPENRGEVAVDGRHELFGWALPPMSPDDRAALRVAAGLIQRRLDEVTGVVTSEFAVRPLAQATEVTAKLLCDQTCRSLLTTELQRFASELQSPCAVAHAAAGARFTALRDLEAVEDHADAIGEAWVRGEGLPDQRAALFALGSVTPVSVREAARSLLAGPPVWGNPTQQSGTPDLPPRPVVPRTGHRSGHSELYEQLVVHEVSEVPPPPLEVELDADGRVVVGPNPVNALFEARMHFAGGWTTDPWRCRAVENLILTTSACVPGIPAGTRVSSACDATDTWITIEGDGATAGQAVGGLVRRLPVWDPAHFGYGAYYRGHEDAEQRRSRVFDAEALPPAPTGEPRPQDLVQALAALGQPDQLEFVGNLPLDEVSSWVDLAAPPAPPARRPRAVARPTVVVDPAAGDTVLVRVLAPWRPEDDAVVTFLDAWWSGPAGVFFRTVREEAGLAYTVIATLDRGAGAGAPVMLTARGTGAEAMLSVLDAELTPQTFEDIRAAALRDLEQGVPFREAPALARQFVPLGFPDGDPMVARRAGLLGLRREDVVRWLATARPPIVRTPSLDPAERLRLVARGVDVQVVPSAVSPP